MKFLGIHGRGTDLKKNSTWHERISTMESLGHTLYVPQLDSCEDPTYESWIKDFGNINFGEYDAIIAISHGSGVLARYIKENNLSLERVIFGCPGRGSHTNTGKVYDYLDTHEVNLEGNIKEIFIVHSKDDEHIDYSKGVDFHKKVGGTLVSLEGIPHKLNGEAVKIINNLAIQGLTQKK